MLNNITCGTGHNTWTVSVDDNQQVTFTFPLYVTVTLPFITLSNFKKLGEMFLGMLKIKEEQTSV